MKNMWLSSKNQIKISWSKFPRNSPEVEAVEAVEEEVLVKSIQILFIILLLRLENYHPQLHPQLLQQLMPKWHLQFTILHHQFTHTILHHHQNVVLSPSHAVQPATIYLVVVDAVSCHGLKPQSYRYLVAHPKIIVLVKDAKKVAIPADLLNQPLKID